MSRFIKSFLLVFISSFSCIIFAKNAVILSSSSTTPYAIGEYTTYLHEKNQKLSLTTAITQLKNSGIKSSKAMLNFGINSAPVWLHFSVNNPTKQALSRQIVIENSWINQVDIFFVHHQQQTDTFSTGDAIPFNDRTVNHRFLIFNYLFKPGISDVYMRVVSEDPMLLPLYITTQEKTTQRSLEQGTYYGFIYGFLMALLAYNLALFFSLKSKRYLYYVLYLLLFLLTNISYTGYGYKLFWPNSPVWQHIANPTLMVLYSLSGLLFASAFLSTKENLPKLHQIIKYTALFFISLLVIALIFNQHVLLLLSAFIFMAIFPLLMVILGIASFKAGVKEAKYFLSATSIAMVGVVIITLAVWGIIPYNHITFHSIEIGMLIESVLLALALAEQFRIMQMQKIEAEFLSMFDPLTRLFNRRGFERSTQGLFSNAKRQQRNFSLLILDLDDFKVLNDSFGHNFGDSVLQESAKIIKNISRQGDVSTRWGGEEFVIALPETNQTEALAFAQRLRVAIASAQLNLGEKRLTFTCSIGIACLTDEMKKIDDLIHAADKNLYCAKEQGKNCVVG